MPPAASASYRSLQDGLRATGHYLDRDHRRLVSLMIVSDGIVVSLRPRDPRGDDEALLLDHDFLRGLWHDACGQRVERSGWTTPDPILPTGYEDFLRAVGDAVARRKWSAVRLVRVGDEVIMRYGSAKERKELVLAAADVDALLNKAFMHRGHGPAS